MPSPTQLILERVQLGRHPLRVGDPLELETSLPRLRARVRETEEAKRLRLAEPALFPLLGGEPPEPDQARLLGVELQVELREPLAKVRPEPLGVVPMLEAHHEVVGETHDDHVPVRVPSPPLVSPEVKDVVRIDVRK
jgi:hypothetical protein